MIHLSILNILAELTDATGKPGYTIYSPELEGQEIGSIVSFSLDDEPFHGEIASYDPATISYDVYMVNLN